MVTDVFLSINATSLNKRADVVSLGLVSSDYQGFYGEINDYDAGKAIMLDQPYNKLVYEEIIQSLCLDNDLSNKSVFNYTVAKDSFTYWTRWNKYGITCSLGSKLSFRQKLINYFKKFKKVQLYVNNICFDVSFLSDIFGSYYNIPININKSVTDINQVIASYLNINVEYIVSCNKLHLFHYLCSQQPIDAVQRYCIYGKCENLPLFSLPLSVRRLNDTFTSMGCKSVQGNSFFNSVLLLGILQLLNKSNDQFDNEVSRYPREVIQEV